MDKLVKERLSQSDLKLIYEKLDGLLQTLTHAFCEAHRIEEILEKGIEERDACPVHILRPRKRGRRKIPEGDRPA